MGSGCSQTTNVLSENKFGGTNFFLNSLLNVQILYFCIVGSFLTTVYKMITLNNVHKDNISTAFIQFYKRMFVMSDGRTSSVVEGGGDE